MSIFQKIFGMFTRLAWIKRKYEGSRDWDWRSASALPERCGGALSVRSSALGEGTTFTVTLPVDA